MEISVEDMTFDTPPPPKTSWVATSTPYWPHGSGHPPQDAIDDSMVTIYHSIDADTREWFQIDVTEARVIQGITVQSRVGFGARIGGVQLRVGLEAVGHTNLQVGFLT